MQEKSGLVSAHDRTALGFAHSFSALFVRGFPQNLPEKIYILRTRTISDTHTPPGSGCWTQKPFVCVWMKWVPFLLLVLSVPLSVARQSSLTSSKSNNNIRPIYFALPANAGRIRKAISLWWLWRYVSRYLSDGFFVVRPQSSRPLLSRWPWRRLASSTMVATLWIRWWPDDAWTHNSHTRTRRESPTVLSETRILWRAAEGTNKHARWTLWIKTSNPDTRCREYAEAGRRTPRARTWSIRRMCAMKGISCEEGGGGRHWIRMPSIIYQLDWRVRTQH